MDASTNSERKKILESVVKHIFRHGFSNLTMDDVAMMHRMSKKTIYHYFTSKDDLLTAAVKSQLEFMEETIGGIVNSSLPVPQKVNKLIETVTKFFGGIGKDMPLDIQRSRPDLWKMIDEFRVSKIFPKIEMIFQQGKAEKYIDEAYDSTIFMQMLINAAQTFINPQYLSNSPHPPPVVFRMVVSTLFFGVLTEKGRDEFNFKELNHPKFPA